MPNDKDYDNLETENTFAMLPALGGTIAFPIGKSTIDLENGRVVFSNKALTQPMSNIITNKDGLHLCKSVHITNDRQMNVYFGRTAGAKTLPAAGSKNIIGIPFDTLIVECFEVTNISFVFSIYPEPIYISGTEDKLLWIISDSTVNFLPAILTNFSANENLVTFTGNKGWVTDIAIESVQPLNWEVWFFRRRTFNNPVLNLDTFIDYVNLNLPVNGRQIGGAGQWYGAARLVDALQYEDLDGLGELHVALVNRSVAAKIAGVGGAVTLKFGIIPTG